MLVKHRVYEQDFSPRLIRAPPARARQTAGSKLVKQVKLVKQTKLVKSGNFYTGMPVRPGCLIRLDSE